MPLTLVTAAAKAPLTLQEVKLHLHVDHVVEDNYISDLITSAVAELDGKDGHLGRALITQTWDLVLDGFPRARNRSTGYQGPFYAADAIEVPLPPLQSVTSITYIDSDGASQTLSSALYTVDIKSEPGRIVPVHGEFWPATRGQINSLTVRFVAGYGTSPTQVPGPIKSALKLMIGNLYENREEFVVGTTAAMLPRNASNLLASYRIWDFDR